MEIRIENLSKRFGDTVALDGVSMRIMDGELMGVLGPSGSGKTTLIRIIAGLIRPDSGKVYFDDRDVTDVPPEKRNVGMVFQNYALFPNMNVEDNIGFGLMVRGRKKGEIRKRVEELLSLVGLEGYEKRRISELSGGEMQRVALARALAPGVGLLLLDEPLSALDAKLRDSLKREIKRIQTETGVTMIYVTHDQREALSISDRVAVINRGRVEQIGSTEEIYWHPENEFVAEFVGEGNVIEGTVNGGAILTEIGKIPMNGIPEGEKVKILIRPENIKLKPLENSIKVDGRIIDIENVGGEIRGIFSTGKIKLRFRTYDTDIKLKLFDENTFYIKTNKLYIIEK